jgi:succinate dehydrogenase / fumarate reductase cytochrome b subunit
MNSLKLLVTSSIGKKILMALTGLALFGFVVGHMVGNLQIFLGPDVLNGYAAFLKSKPALIWGARIGLLACVALHIICAIALTKENRKAAASSDNPSRTAHKASYASRTMIWSGLIVLTFILYHLAHFTVGWIDGEYLTFRDTQGRHDVYQMVVRGFSNVGVSLFYVASMFLLCTHLSHGMSSLFQSLGVRNKQNEKLFDTVAKLSAAIIFVGNCSIPFFVLTGVLKA